MPRSWLFAAKIGLLAVAYWLAAKLSRALAIPPGHATPVWPASGIALAVPLMLGGRALAGGWRGSRAANLGVENSFAVPLLVATGSTVQALAATTVVRRLVGVPYRFESAREVVQFVAAVALCSTIAPTFALAGLAVTHRLSAA